MWWVWKHQSRGPRVRPCGATADLYYRTANRFIEYLVNVVISVWHGILLQRISEIVAACANIPTLKKYNGRLLPKTDKDSKLSEYDKNLRKAKWYLVDF